MQLSAIDNWVFDMDGTLTVAVHDFEKIRKAIGLPPGEPILEALDKMPDEEAEPKRALLDEMEFELARLAKPAAGARDLLQALREEGCNVGILTRNGVEIAMETLRCCGLSEFFERPFVIGRELARPKPDPDGVLQLLQAWSVSAQRSVMVGDYYFDLAAGRAAGTRTIYFDAHESGEWSAMADVTVTTHHQICSLLEKP